MSIVQVSHEAYFGWHSTAIWIMAQEAYYKSPFKDSMKHNRAVVGWFR
jgi:hypothetical protein